MFLFSDAKVRRFSHTSQIYQQQIIKIFPFIDINQNLPYQNGRFEACKVFLYKERFKKVWVVFLCFVYLQAKHYNYIWNRRNVFIDILRPQGFHFIG